MTTSSWGETQSRHERAAEIKPMFSCAPQENGRSGLSSYRYHEDT